jgi:predicted ATPase
MAMTPGGTPLLEREAALASIAEYAQDARRGEGRLVLVNGEARVGKWSRSPF